MSERDYCERDGEFIGGGAVTSTQQRMDEAAAGARVELEKMDTHAVLHVAAWLKKHYLEAGYKRLCKTLLEESGLK